MIDFWVEFLKYSDVHFSFEDGERVAVDKGCEEPTMIKGTVHLENEEIGDIVLYELYNDEDFLSKCDFVSGDCEIIASVVCDESGAVSDEYLNDYSRGDNIIILDSIRIDEHYRNQGIGSTLISNLAEMLEYQFGEFACILLYAGDFEAAKKYGFDSPEYEEGSRRLVEFYKRLGFEHIDKNVMIYTL